MTGNNPKGSSTQHPTTTTLPTSKQAPDKKKNPKKTQEAMKMTRKKKKDSDTQDMDDGNGDTQQSLTVTQQEPASQIFLHPGSDSKSTQQGTAVQSTPHHPLAGHTYIHERINAMTSNTSHESAEESHVSVPDDSTTSAVPVAGETATRPSIDGSEQEYKAQTIQAQRQNAPRPPVYNTQEKAALGNLSLIEHKLFDLGRDLESRLSRDMRAKNRELAARFSEPPPQSARTFSRRLDALKTTLDQIQIDMQTLQGVRTDGDPQLLQEPNQLNARLTDIEDDLTTLKQQLGLDRLPLDEDAQPRTAFDRIGALEIAGNDANEDRTAVVFTYLLEKVQTLYRELQLPVPTGNSLPLPEDEHLSRNSLTATNNYNIGFLENLDHSNQDIRQEGETLDGAPPAQAEQTNPDEGQALNGIPTANEQHRTPDEYLEDYAAHAARNTVPIIPNDDGTTPPMLRNPGMRITPSGIVVFPAVDGVPDVEPEYVEALNNLLQPQQTRTSQQVTQSQSPQTHLQHQRPSRNAQIYKQPEFCGTLSGTSWNGTFEGSSDEDIILFLEEFDLHCLMNKADATEKVALLRLRLKGLARYTIAAMSETDKNSYNMVRAKLIDTFNRQDQYVHARTAIRQLQYGSSFSDFLARLTPLIQKAYPNTSQEVRDMKTFDILMDKMPGDLLTEIMRLGCDTLQELLLKAPKMEAFVKDTTSRRLTHDTHVPRYKAQPVAATFLSEEQTNVGLVGTERSAPNAPRPSPNDQAPPARYKANRRNTQPAQQSFNKNPQNPRGQTRTDYRQPNQRQNNQQNVSCAFCGNSGHLMMVCRKYIRSQNQGTTNNTQLQRAQTFQQPKANRSPVTCYNCGQIGHIVRQCPYPRRQPVNQGYLGGLAGQFAQLQLQQQQQPQQTMDNTRRMAAIMQQEQLALPVQSASMPLIQHQQPQQLVTQQPQGTTQPTVQVPASSTHSQANAIVQGTKTTEPLASDKPLPEKFTIEDFIRLNDQVNLLSSKLYQKQDQENPSPDILATLTRHEGTQVPEFVPVDYRLVIIPVIIDGHGCTALFDSGSSITIAPIGLASILNISLTDSNKSILSVTGHTASAPKKGQVRLTIAGHTRQVEVHFVSNTLGLKNPYDIIIGVDTMTVFPLVTLDVINRRITVGQHTVSWKTKAELLREDRKVFVTREFTIPPNSQAIVDALIDKSKGEVTPSMTIEKAGQHPIEVTATLTDVSKDYKCKVALSNPYTTPITIKPFTVIASAQNVIGDDDNLTNVPEITAAMVEDFKHARKYTDPDPSYVVDYSRCDCTDEQRLQLKELLNTYRDTFSKNGYDLGMAKVNPMQIRTTTEVPFRPSIYPVDRNLRDKVREDLDNMKNMGCIVESDTPWLSPLVMVKKKTGELRPCIDLRKLNAITIPDYYPLPKVSNTLDRVAGSFYLTSLDLNKGFWQLPLSDEASWKCGIICENEVLQCLRMPFGLRNAPAAFSRAMDTVLGPVKNICVVYIDDVIIMTKTDSFAQHLADIEAVLKRLQLFNLKINPKKCEFARREITFLGHIISANGIRPDERNVVKIQELPTPRNTHDLRHCIGMFSFFRRLIPSFAHTASPLTALCGKGSKFIWTDECQKAFDTLKRQLTSSPTIHFPLEDREFHIFLDASKKAFGIALTQTKKGDEKFPIYYPISFYSRALSKSEQNYPAVQLELMALMLGLRLTSYYTYGQTTIVHTDHKPLIHLMSKRTTHPMLARWLIELQQYDNVIIKHIKGSQNTLADALSRLETLFQDHTEGDLEDAIKGIFGLDTDPENTSQCNTLWTLRSDKTAAQLQITDKVLAEAIQAIKAKTDPTAITDPEIRWYVCKCELDDSDTLRLKPKTDSDIRRLIVPKELRHEVFKHFHSSMTGGGHMSTQKTCDKMQDFAWRNMAKDIADWHKRCLQCQIRSPPRHKVPLVMTKLNRPFQKLGLDICGPLHLTADNNRHYLLGIDNFTKYIVTVAIPDTKSATVIQALWDNIILRFGTPEAIITDNASTFTSHFFQEVMTKLGIRKEFSTPHHSDGNAITERPFRTFHDMIAKYFAPSTHSAESRDWDRVLQAVTFAYNVTPHKTTGESPFKLMHGRDPSFPAHLIIHGGAENASPPIKQFRMELTQTIDALHKRAAESLALQADKMKLQADKTSRESDLSVGELVLYRDYSLRVGMSTKYKNPWGSIYRIRAIEGQHTWITPLTQPNESPKRVHLNQVKRFYTDEESTSSTPAALPATQVQPTQNWKARKQQRKEAHEQHMTSKPPHKRRGEGTKYNLRQFDKSKGGDADVLAHR
jgi:hypothetical protein